MASTYLTRTLGSGNQQLWTWSGWIKRSKLGTFQALFGNQLDGGTIGYIAIGSDDKLDLNSKISSTGGEGNSTRVFRDTSAWYHLVIVFKGAESNANDRFEIYVNGEQDTYVSRGSVSAGNGYVNSNIVHGVGALGSGNSYYDGSMSHVHFIDGTAYDADTFGETDSTTGIWKPKTAPSVTYGTNGFFLKFENSGAFGTDSSGNSNNFTVNGTMTQTIDTPSNVFATLNAIDTFPETDYSNGNTKSTRSGGGYRSAFSTLGFTTGKYYAEFKVYDVANGNGLGVLNLDKYPYGTYISGTEKYVGINGNAVGLFSNILYYNNVNQGGTWTSWSNGNIIGLAVDATNGYAYWSVNGTWQNSGNPTAGTGGYALSNIGSNGTYVMGCSNSTSSTEVNFGNGYFGTTAVSSAQNPDDGIGIFEYDVPTGYRALCTKSINAEEYS